MSSGLDTLKKDMVQTKEELEKYKADVESLQEKLALETEKREAAEAEVSSLKTQLYFVEGEFERSEELLVATAGKLAKATAAAKESAVREQDWEGRATMAEGRVEALEDQLAEAKSIGRYLDKKYSAACGKICVKEHELERTEEREDEAMAKVVELEKGLRAAEVKLRSLEAFKEMALKSEEFYAEQVGSLGVVEREAVGRAETAEREVKRLEQEVKRLEQEVLMEQAIYAASANNLQNVYGGGGRYNNRKD